MTLNEAIRKYRLLDMQIVHDNGSYKRLRCWFEGWHPDLFEIGNIKMIPNGLQGKETILTVEVIRPVREVQVEEEQTPQSFLCLLKSKDRKTGR